MIKNSLILLCILSTFNSAYLPFKKNRDFPDDTCGYSFKDNYYVKDCESGKYCKYRSNGAGLLRCENVPSEVVLTSLDGTCESDFECETGLRCINSRCSYSSDCPEGETRVRTQSGYICKDPQTSNIFYTKDFTWHEQTGSTNGYIDGTSSFDSYGPDYLKVEGKITGWNITRDTNGKIYEPTTIEYSDIGSVEDGEYVYNELACKSGFALYFYGDGKLENPYNNNHNYMYKKCVTLEEIEKKGSYCKIKYSLDGKSLTYDVNRINNNAKTISQYNNNNDDNNNNYPILNCYYISHCTYDYFSDIIANNLCNNIDNKKIKIDIFKKYVESLTDDVRKCTTPEYNNPATLETCQNNELRKWSYFYDNEDEYVLYYKDDDDKGKMVTNFLIQTAFPSYQTSSFLNIKYMTICLLLLILLI